MDDVLIPSRDFEEGLIALRNVLDAFKNAGLALKMTKCHFFRKRSNIWNMKLAEKGLDQA